MASLTLWTWIWVSSRSWRWTGKPGVLQSMGSQRVGHDWVTELNWTPFKTCNNYFPYCLIYILILCRVFSTYGNIKILCNQIRHCCPFWSLYFMLCLEMPSSSRIKKTTDYCFQSMIILYYIFLKNCNKYR